MRATRPCRALRRILRLNARWPKPRGVLIRAIPLVVCAPYDTSTLEQIAVGDVASLAVQVGLVVWGLSRTGLASPHTTASSPTLDQ
jgi:hypothetical protein